MNTLTVKKGFHILTSFSSGNSLLERMVAEFHFPLVFSGSLRKHVIVVKRKNSSSTCVKKPASCREGPRNQLVSSAGLKSFGFCRDFGAVSRRNMEDENVIKLPVTEDKITAKKRGRPPKFDAEEEERLRQKNLKRLAVLGEEDDSVKRLETLVFGAEEELLERLVEVMFSTRLHSENSEFNFNSLKCQNYVQVLFFYNKINFLT